MKNHRHIPISLLNTLQSILVRDFIAFWITTTTDDRLITQFKQRTASKRS